MASPKKNSTSISTTNRFSVLGNLTKREKKALNKPAHLQALHKQPNVSPSQSKSVVTQNIPISRESVEIVLTNLRNNLINLTSTAIKNEVEPLIPIIDQFTQLINKKADFSTIKKYLSSQINPDSSAHLKETVLLLFRLYAGLQINENPGLAKLPSPPTQSKLPKPIKSQPQSAPVGAWLKRLALAAVPLLAAGQPSNEIQYTYADPNRVVHHDYFPANASRILPCIDNYSPRQLSFSDTLPEGTSIAATDTFSLDLGIKRTYDPLVSCDYHITYRPIIGFRTSPRTIYDPNNPCTGEFIGNTPAIPCKFGISGDTIQIQILKTTDDTMVFNLANTQKGEQFKFIAQKGISSLINSTELKLINSITSFDIIANGSIYYNIESPFPKNCPSIPTPPPIPPLPTPAPTSKDSKLSIFGITAMGTGITMLILSLIAVKKCRPEERELRRLRNARVDKAVQIMNGMNTPEDLKDFTDPISFGPIRKITICTCDRPHFFEKASILTSTRRDPQCPISRNPLSPDAVISDSFATGPFKGPLSKAMARAKARIDRLPQGEQQDHQLLEVV